MSSTASDDAGAEAGTKRYFCNEPWIGLLSIGYDRRVTFCPCFLKLKLGSLAESSLQELWNAPALVAIRREFEQGRLPEACRGQLCEPALGLGGYPTERPE
jgi:MoaA/NifB/PqqE/SkfB family radical SAM enzyme